MLSISVHVAWRKLPLEVLMGHVRGKARVRLRVAVYLEAKVRRAWQGSFARPVWNDDVRSC